MPLIRPVLALSLALMATAPSASFAVELKTQLRRPTALVLGENGEHLYVANARSGSVSTVDVKSGEVVSESSLGRNLADMIRLPGGRLAVVDTDGHELLVLEPLGSELKIAAKLPVAKYPVGLAASPDGRRLVVTSLWSRRLTFVDVNASGTPEIRGELDLTFAPRRIVFLPDGRHCVVADSFAGALATVDCETRSITHRRDILANNIRGLAISPDGRRLLVAHSFLNEYAQSFNNDVTWGVLTSNSLHGYELASFLSESTLPAGSKAAQAAELHMLGEPGAGGADPGGIALAPDGTALVTLGGAQQLAVCVPEKFEVAKLPAGQRPTAVVVSADGKTAYVANTNDDTLGVYDLSEPRFVRNIPLGPQPALTAADRGEQLFFDGRLAHDRWMSCHTCHSDGHTNGGVNDNFTDGSFGAAKRVLTLLGARDTAPYAWNGKMPSLEHQAQSSVSSTMQGRKRIAEADATALAAFVQTLAPAPSVNAARATLDRPAIERGQQLFGSLKCVECHVPPTYTSPETYDVGLVDSQGVREFNPPSLRGLSQRGKFFHDNRAPSLDSVFREHKHQLPRDLTDQERAALVTFLESL